MATNDLAGDIKRIFSKNEELPLLLRGTGTGYAMSIFTEGVLTPLNDLGAFFFWAVPEAFDRYGIPIEKSEIGVDSYKSAYGSSVDWAALHTDGYEMEQFDISSMEGREGMERILQKKKGVVIGFNHQVVELGMFPEMRGEGHIVTTSQPVEIRCKEGIPLRYISRMDPVGELDKAILINEYEKILGHKLTPEELAGTTLR